MKKNQDGFRVFMRKRNKTLRIMKLTLMFLIIGMLQVSASVYSQNGKINVNVEGVELSELIWELQESSEVVFIYKSSDLKGYDKITLNKDGASLKEILDEALEGKDLQYTIDDDDVVIIKKKEPVKRVPAIIKEQEKKKELKGTVTDKGGNTLPGVSIVVKGTTTGSATNIDGDYYIMIPDNAKVLVFSFIGMESKEVPYEGQEILDVVLNSSTKEVDEVVITGFQEIKKERMTGSFNTVSAKQMENEGITSIDQALEGLVEGLNSTITSGAPGERAQIRIRGNNSINGNNEPLWVIDGLPELNGVPIKGDLETTVMTDGIGNVHPDEIASITVLKDASATSIYGARAANGVIVVTTKKGYKGKTSFSYSGNMSYETQRSSDPMYMNSNEKIDYELSLIEEFNTSSYGGKVSRLWESLNKGYLSRVDYEKEIQHLRSIDTDWMNEIFRSAKSQSHNFSIRGGSDELTYYTSLSVRDQEGILRSNSYQNIGISSRMDYQPSKNFSLGIDLRGNVVENKDHNSSIDPLTYAIYANPYERPYEDNGDYSWDRSYSKGGSFDENTLPSNISKFGDGYLFDFNMLNELENTQSKKRGTDLSATLNIRWRLHEDLMLTAHYRSAVSSNTTMNTINPGTYSSYLGATYAKKFFNQELPDAYNNGSMSEGSGRSSAWSGRAQFEYSKTLNNHFISVLGASEMTRQESNTFNYTSPEYLPQYRLINIPELPLDNDILLEDYRDIIGRFMNTSEGQNRSVSFIGNISYTYKSKYSLNFSYRADGADKIGSGKRFTPLWSIGTRLNLHNESFFKKLPFVSEFAIRGSFGYTGNIDREAYPFTVMNMSSERYSNQYIPSGVTWPNPVISWEKKTDRNIGVDLGLFNNRVSITGNYYLNDSNNLLGGVSLPKSTGRKSAKANALSLENEGWELAIGLKWVKTKNWMFTTRINAGHNKNTVTKARMKSIEEMWNRGGSAIIEGEETGSVYGYKYGGVDPMSGNPTFVLSNEAKMYLQQWLDNEFVNLSDAEKEDWLTKKGLTDSQNAQSTFKSRGSEPYTEKGLKRTSMVNLGTTNPKLIGGFSTYLKYKGFELSSRWSFKLGHILKSYEGSNNGNIGRSYFNKLKLANYRWRNKGDITQIPRFTATGSDHYSMSEYSNKYEKGDYLRLKSIVLGWYFPREWNEKLGLTKAKISVQARDLLTFTKYTGLDVATGGAARYPISKKFVVNLSVSF